MRYFSCLAVEVDSGVGVTAVVCETFRSGSGVEVGVVCSARVASGGGVANVETVDAADDRASQALRVMSDMSRIPVKVLMRGIILHSDLSGRPMVSVFPHRLTDLAGLGDLL